MAKSINVSGRMSVGRFEEEFQKTFGVRCNIKLSKWKNADNSSTLSSIRPKDFEGPKKVNLPIVGNMTVGTLKKRFEENFGVMIELYIGRKIAPDNVTIGAVREGRAKAPISEKPKKAASKSPKPESAEKPSSSNLTDEQIKEFKEQEEEAEDSWDYRSLAQEVSEAGDKVWGRELYDKALDSDGSFDDFKELCTDYLDDKSIFDEEYFEKAFEKALGLKSSADEDDINSFADSLKEAGETDKLEKLKESLNIEIGITHNIEINGDSVFRCSFDIDFNYYEEQTGDEGPERFEFDYDFKNGVIVGYDYFNAELDCVRIPQPDEEEIWSLWYLGQSGDYMNDDFIHMHGDEISDVEGEHAAEMEEIVKTINPRIFKELASAVLNKIKELEGIN